MASESQMRAEHIADRTRILDEYAKAILQALITADRMPQPQSESMLVMSSFSTGEALAEEAFRIAEAALVIRDQHVDAIVDHAKQMNFQ